MYQNKEICGKIASLFPEFGTCGDNIHVAFNNQVKSWEVEFTRNGKKLKTYLEKSDLDSCMDKGVCIGLGIEVFQLDDNLKKV